MPVLLYTTMGGRKFRFSTRKNEERKRRQKKMEEKQKCLDNSCPPPVQNVTISLPISMYHEGAVSTVEQLTSQLLSGHSLPATRIVARQNPLLLCKLRMRETRVSLDITVSVQHNFSWIVTVGSQALTVSLYPLLVGVPNKLTSASAVCRLLSTLDGSKLCPGNQEPKFLELWKYRSLTLHGSLGKSHVHVCPNCIDYNTCTCKFTPCPQDRTMVMVTRLTPQECQAFDTPTVICCLETHPRQLDVALVLLYVAFYVLKAVDM